MQLQAKDDEAMPTSVRLSADIEDKLDQLAKDTGRSKAFYIRKVIETYIDEIIDCYRVDRAIKEIKSGKRTAISQDEVEKMFDVG